MKTNQKGFSIFEGLLVVVVIVLLGAVGWLVYDRQNNKTEKNNEQSVTQTDKKEEKKEEPKEEVKADPNEGYLVVKQWGLRFKVPSTLTEVKYHINGDTLAFFAKPTGSSVEYRSDYDKVENNFFQYALGRVYRSSESTQFSAGNNVPGKKIGNYYYYTAHAFSGLATGAAATGLYFDASCDQNNTNVARCDELLQAEVKAFNAINQDNTALLNTIEAAQ